MPVGRSPADPPAPLLRASEGPVTGRPRRWATSPGPPRRRPERFRQASCRSLRRVRCSAVVRVVVRAPSAVRSRPSGGAGWTPAVRPRPPIPPVTVRGEKLTPTRPQRRRPHRVRLPPLTPWSGVVLGLWVSSCSRSWSRPSCGRASEAFTLPAGPGRHRRGRGVRAPVPGMKKPAVRLTERRANSSSPR
jgi:hypothetical protein